MKRVCWRSKYTATQQSPQFSIRGIVGGLDKPEARRALLSVVDQAETMTAVTGTRVALGNGADAPWMPWAARVEGVAAAWRLFR